MRPPAPMPPKPCSKAGERRQLPPLPVGSAPHPAAPQNSPLQQRQQWQAVSAHVFLPPLSKQAHSSAAKSTSRTQLAVMAVQVLLASWGCASCRPSKHDCRLHTCAPSLPHAHSCPPEGCCAKQQIVRPYACTSRCTMHPLPLHSCPPEGYCASWRPSSTRSHGSASPHTIPTGTRTA